MSVLVLLFKNTLICSKPPDDSKSTGPSLPSTFPFTVMVVPVMATPPPEDNDPLVIVVPDSWMA
jgi:hypothetical protein